MKHPGLPRDVGVVFWCLARSLLSGAYQRRLVLTRRLPRRAGRRRIVRGSDRTVRHRVPAGRHPQGLDFARPGREPESFLMTTGCARPLEDVARIAQCSHLPIMATACAARAPATASMRSTPTCFLVRTRPARKHVDPKVTAGASIIRKYPASRHIDNNEEEYCNEV
jgi:hypothetical protein